MPVRVIETLMCDAPECDEPGEWCAVEIGGRRVEMILGPRHLKPLLEVAKWGKPADRRRASTRAAKRRGSDERRILSLLDADREPEG